MSNFYVLKCSKKKFIEYNFNNEEVKSFIPNLNNEKKETPENVGIEDIVLFLEGSLGPSVNVSEERNPHCNSCNMDLFTVSETGIFGCDDCFPTFESFLKDKFYKEYMIYESRIEKQKSIKKENMEEIQALRDKIEELISEEKYEDIAKINNELQRIEKGES